MPFDIWSELVVTALCGASLVVWIGRDLAARVVNRGQNRPLSQPEIQQCSPDLILGGSATGDCSLIPSPANGYNFFSLTSDGVKKVA